MNDFELSPDDPRLTAYALGELEGDERAAVEAAVRRDPELRAALEDIRATAAQVEAALAAEAAEPGDAIPFPHPNGRVHAPAAAPRHAHAGEPVRVEFSAPAETPRLNGAHRARRGPPKVLRFPQMYFVAGGLAAACFTIIALRHPASPPPPAAARAAGRPPVFATAAPATADAAPAAPVAADLAAERSRETNPAPVAVDLPAPAPLRLESLAPAPAASSAETLAAELSLVGQARAMQQSAAEENPPLAPPPAPLVAGVPQSLTVGLPREAAPPLVPPTVGARGPASGVSRSTHAMVRPQDAADAMRIAELKAIGSEAERARLVGEERRRIEAERRALAELAPGANPPGERAARAVATAAPRSAGLTGDVRVIFSVDATGAVRDARIAHTTDPRLAEPALAAVRTWQFEPAVKSGRAVTARLQATLVFRGAGGVDVSAPIPTSER